MNEDEKRELTLKVLEVFKGKKFSEAHRILMDCIQYHLGDNSEIISDITIKETISFG